MSVATLNKEEIPFSIRAACERIGMARQDLAGCIYHKMKTFFPHLTDAARKVVTVLLDHANPDHNRVWCSVSTIAEEAPGRGTDGGLATSTVDAVMEELREAGAVRLLFGEELLEGDGPHTAKDRGVKRKGRHPVNTYDISGLFAFLPPILRRLLAGACKMLARIAAPPKAPSIQEQYQAVANELPAVSSSPIPVPTRHYDGTSGSTVQETLGENLGPPGKPISGVGIGLVARTPETPPPSERTTTEQRIETTQPAPGRSVPNPKNRGPNKSGEEKLNKSEWTAIQALRGVGLHPIRKAGGIYEDVPKEIVKSMTVSWAMELVEFYYWRERRSDPIKPEFLYGVWQNWKKGDGEWPRVFELELDAVNRAKSAARALAEKPKQERKPASKPVEVPIAAPDFDLAAVPEGEREELLAIALKAVLDDETMQGAAMSRFRDRIASEGFDHPRVRVEAQRILTEKGKNSGT